MSIASAIKNLKNNNFISGLVSKKSVGQFKRYLVTGFLSFGVEYLAFLVLYRCLKLWYLAANTIVYITVFWFNFLMNRIWSFRSKDKLLRQLLMYGALFAFNLAVTNIIMYLLTDIGGISPLLSKVMVMCAVVSWNFIIYNKLIYK